MIKGWHPPKLTVGCCTAKLRLKRSGKWVSKPIVLTRKPRLKHILKGLTTLLDAKKQHEGHKTY